MEIKAGKRYNRRDGGVSGMLSYSDRGTNYVFTDGKYSYTKNGNYLIGGEYSPHNLISEYVEPTAEPTEAPVTDEWGPWALVSDGHHDVPDIFEGIETVYRDGKLYKWRVKKAPEVREHVVHIGKNGVWAADNGKTTRKAIITLTDGVPSIRWAD